MSLSRSLGRSCSRLPTQLRNFSTTSSNLIVPPEAPHYIDVPLSVQEDQRIRRRVRGVLPVPREIFPVRQSDKPSPAYLARATKDANRRTEPTTEQMAWRQHMTDVRKQHLRDGLVELHQRKGSHIERMTARSTAKTSAREVLLRQPPREDDRLTSASILKEMKPVKQPTLPSPNQEGILAVKRANVEKKAAEKREERRDSLHTLYMKARNFITTEEQLAEEVRNVFPDGTNQDWVNSRGQEAPNIWGLGVPPTVANMVESITTSTNPERSQRAQSTTELGQYNVSQDRLKKIAEELTGGKI